VIWRVRALAARCSGMSSGSSTVISTTPPTSPPRCPQLSTLSALSPDRMENPRYGASAQPKYLRDWRGRFSQCFQPRMTTAASRPKTPQLAPRLGRSGAITIDSSPPVKTLPK
jgi:hypothetical protein